MGLLGGLGFRRSLLFVGMNLDFTIGKFGDLDGAAFEQGLFAYRIPSRYIIQIQCQFELGRECTYQLSTR